jgi:hypothetical protein
MEDTISARIVTIATILLIWKDHTRVTQKQIQSHLGNKMEIPQEDLDLLEKLIEEINDRMQDIDGDGDKVEIFAEEMLHNFLISITQHLPGSPEEQRVVLRGAFVRKLLDLDRSPEYNGLFLAAMNNNDKA